MKSFHLWPFKRILSSRIEEGLLGNLVRTSLTINKNTGLFYRPQMSCRQAGLVLPSLNRDSVIEAPYKIIYIQRTKENFFLIFLCAVYYTTPHMAITGAVVFSRGPLHPALSPGRNVTVQVFHCRYLNQSSSVCATI